MGDGPGARGPDMKAGGQITQTPIGFLVSLLFFQLHF